MGGLKRLLVTPLNGGARRVSAKKRLATTRPTRPWPAKNGRLTSRRRRPAAVVRRRRRRRRRPLVAARHAHLVHSPPPTRDGSPHPAPPPYLPPVPPGRSLLIRFVSFPPRFPYSRRRALYVRFRFEKIVAATEMTTDARGFRRRLIIAIIAVNICRPGGGGWGGQCASTECARGTRDSGTSRCPPTMHVSENYRRFSRILCTPFQRPYGYVPRL